MKALLVVLMVWTLAACTSVEGLRIGSQAREWEATTIPYVQRLIKLYGEQGAIDRLVAAGTKEKDARRRVLDAQAAKGGE